VLLLAPARCSLTRCSVRVSLFLPHRLLSSSLPVVNNEALCLLLGTLQCCSCSGSFILFRCLAVSDYNLIRTAFFTLPRLRSWISSLLLLARRLLLGDSAFFNRLRHPGSVLVDLPSKAYTLDSNPTATGSCLTAQTLNSPFQRKCYIAVEYYRSSF
jgi:hypothetical protein